MTLGELLQYELDNSIDYDKEISNEIYRMAKNANIRYEADRTLQADRDSKDQGTGKESGSTKPTGQYAQSNHTDR